MDPRNHRSITSSLSAWNERWPTKTLSSPDILTYTQGLVSTLPPANYSRATMNAIDHIYIDLLPRSIQTTINRYFSTCVIQQQRTHEQQSPRSQTTPHIMSIYWDHAMSRPEILIALINYLQPIMPWDCTSLYPIHGIRLPLPSYNEHATYTLLLMPSCITVHDRNCTPKRNDHATMWAW